MRRQQKKAFTLVELLVVIAILAILASVAVVGYTSFMKNAALSNDESLVTQLNRYFEAMKADSTSAYSVEEFDVTEDNAWVTIDAILRESGIGEIEPDSLKYGYHIYFNTDTDKFELDNLKKEGNTWVSGLRAIFNRPITANGEAKPGVFETTDKKYFLADTKGSVLAEAVRAFHTFDLDKNAEDYEDKVKAAFNKLINDAKKSDDENGTMYAQLLENKGLLVDKYILTNNTDTETVKDPIIHKNVTDYSNIKMSNVQEDESGNISAKITTPSTDETTTTLEISTDTTISITEGSSICAGSFNIGVEEGSNATLTLDITVANPEAVADMVDVAFASATNVKIVINGQEYEYTNATTLTNKSNTNETIGLKYRNPLGSFNVQITGDSDNNAVNNDGTNVGSIAWDAADFAFEIKDAKGREEDNAVISDYRVDWSVVEGYETYITESNDVFNFTNTWPENGVVKIKATAIVDKDGVENGVNEPATQEFTINIGKLSSVGMIMSKYGDKADATDKTLTNGGKVLLVHSDTVNEHYIKKGELTYNNNDVVKNITLGSDLALSYTKTTGADVTVSGNKITTSGAGTGVLTVTVGKGISYTLNVEIFDESALPVQVNNNIVYVGSQDKLYVNDFFTVKNGFTVPDTAEIRICSTYANDDFVYFNRNYVEYVDRYAGDEADWNRIYWNDTTGFQFTETSGEDTVVLAVYDNGVRISNDIRVVVVDALNVRTYAGLTTNTSTSKVLLNSVAMAEGDSIITLTSATLYGNNFTIDLRNYDDDGTPFEDADGNTSFTFVDLKKTVPYARTDEALVTLNKATLNNVKIVGEAYASENFIYQNPTDFAYGASLVKATDGSYIVGCYLANTRAPLTMTGTVTVEDTVLFGGNYANIVIEPTKNSSDSIVAGELILKGVVTTINQIIENETTSVGLGIVVDPQVHKNTKVTLENANTLVQYNYVKQSECTNLPVVTYTMDLDSMGTEDINVFTSTEVAKIFTEGAYADWVFDHNGEEYINSGVIFLNSMEFSCSGSDFFSKLAAGTLESVLKGLYGNSCGTGDNLSAYPTGYGKTSTTISRTKTKSNITVSLTEYMYVQAPKKTTTTFNNVVPNEYLPSNILGE